MIAATTQAERLTLGLELSAVGLVIGAFVLLLTGTSGSLGTALRATLEPALSRARETSVRSRPELADLTLLAGIALAGASVVFDRHLLAAFVVIGLWLARPIVRRHTREENRLLAMADSFSLDMIIGFYAPLTAAQFLFGNVLMGCCFATVVVALSWPAGGGSSIPGRRWRLAPVAS